VTTRPASADHPASGLPDGAVAGEAAGEQPEARVVRIRFAKRGRVRFISHRDVARAFERALRVAELPVAVTRGFTPHPRIGFGLALAVGHESDAEYLDVGFDRPVRPHSVVAGLAAVLPEGLVPDGAVELAPGAPALQEAVTSVEYAIDAGAPEPAAREAVGALLAAGEAVLTRSRKGREATEDVRPLVRRLSLVEGGDGWTRLQAEIATRPRGLRPSELLEVLGGFLGPEAGVRFTERRVRRTHQWMERGGARLEPLEADPRRRAPEVRAS